MTASYRAKSSRPSRAEPSCGWAGLQLSAVVDKLTVRASDTTILRDGRMASNVAHVEAGLKLSDNVTAIAGIRHGVEGDPGLGSLTDRNKGTWREAGVQIKGVPLVFGVLPRRWRGVGRRVDSVLSRVHASTAGLPRVRRCLYDFQRQQPRHKSALKVGIAQC